jgi:hypothetical protein
VTRRECGTCRFFEQSGIGESGWCRNQRCREIVGLALVRRQELACRIGWDKDYYEALYGNDALPGQNRPAPDPARQRTGYQGTRPDDIIVGVEQPRPVPEQPVMPPTRGRASNVGEAHRRALERRQVAQQSGEALPPRRLSGALPLVDQPGIATEHGRDYAPERARPLTGEEGVSPPRRAESPPQPPDTSRHLATTANIPVASDASERIGSVPPADPRWSPPPGMQTSPAPLDPRRIVAQTRDVMNAPLASHGEPPEPPFTFSSPSGAPQSPLEAEWYQAERQRHRGKRCANCRDFQVAESGDRGWCRNHFAFPTPQLVGPNDLACLSCIGTWWAASDQWWLAKAPAPQQMPTPLADELLEEMREEEQQHARLRRPGAS